MRTSTLLFALFVFGNASATTWVDTEVNDPIKAGAKCHVQEPASFGGYIFNWPSKYDQVFWPLIEESGLWFCEESGFIAFIGDFEGLTDDDRKEIGTYLRDNYKGTADRRGKLKLLQDIYSLRDKDTAFQNKLIRVLARWYQDLGDYDHANALRRLALEQIRTELHGNLPQQRRLEYLYVACNYDVFFGNTRASDCVRSVQSALDQTTDEDLTDYVEYLNELLQETNKIRPGNVIDPAEDDAKQLKPSPNTH